MLRKFGRKERNTKCIATGPPPPPRHRPSPTRKRAFVLGSVSDVAADPFVLEGFDHLGVGRMNSGRYRLHWGVTISIGFGPLLFCRNTSCVCFVLSLFLTSLTHATLSSNPLLQNCQCCNYHCYLFHLVVLVSSERSTNVAFARISKADASAEG